MTHASLFSGIGGAELAASWLGWNNLFHCEINPFGRKVIEYWFPKSKSYADIKTTDFREWRGKVDILTGGFPCQPFSQAGKRCGDTDDRYLWPQMLRAIREVQPTWVIGENVAGITSMVESGEDVEMGRGSNLFEESIIYRKEQKFTIERICEDFESIGYQIQPIVIPACAVGAPHRRDRVWFIAHRNSDRRRNRKNEQELIKWGERKADNCVSSEDGIVTNTRLQRQKKSKEQTVGAIKFYECKTIADTIYTRNTAQRNGANTNEPKEMRGNKSQSEFTRYGSKQIIADTNGERIKGELFGRPTKIQFGRQNSRIIQTNWDRFPTQSPICCGNDGVSDRLDGITFPHWRVESIKAYGNAWVPQVAYEIFMTINNLQL